ncbi:hypothetical protein DPX16_11877 [Anabarilius grahami]|uniref:Uncharacterized protein n=1 Tax=Anabarilius grahami TaxID=495550 RepID=A0A3N0YC67_ANAGA|nr:hypothetical protein DPX16_11877 [Anabarilius grahami]
MDSRVRLANMSGPVCSGCGSMVTVAGWSLKGSGRQMKKRMRSDGDEVLYSLNQKHTLPVARCWSDWTVSVEREAAE